MTPQKPSDLNVQWPSFMDSPMGVLSFDKIDGPNDQWFWAITLDYEGPQDYSYVVMGFNDEFLPLREEMAAILAALEPLYVALEDR